MNRPIKEAYRSRNGGVRLEDLFPHEGAFFGEGKHFPEFIDVELIA
ncbi:hypothetical protein ES703_60282 [subsurface metagenome]